MRAWPWLTSKAGWLLYKDKKFQPDEISGLNLFGSVTFWIFWQNGYEALCALDNHGNGRLSGSDLDELAIWQDLDSNGKIEMGEVKSVKEWGITSISCQYEIGKDGMPFSSDGLTLITGEHRPTYDWVLRSF